MSKVNILFIFFLTILLNSCINSERKGLSKKDRHYGSTIALNNCETSCPTDLMIITKHLQFDLLYNEMVHFSDSILGGPITNAIKHTLSNKLHSTFFPFEQTIKDSNLLIDQINLWKISDVDTYFSNNNITPMQLDWKKCIQYDSPLIIYKTIGDWEITQKITCCISPNWKAIGQFKTVEKHPSSIEVYPYFGYVNQLRFQYKLTVRNKITGKKEAYQFTRMDACREYTKMDFEVMDILNNETTRNGVSDPSKKVHYMKEYEN